MKRTSIESELTVLLLTVAAFVAVVVGVVVALALVFGIPAL